jgi:hypothetical protein
MLNPQPTPVAKPAQQQAENSFVSALSAQKAFFQQVTAPKITPATYTAADIARATPAAIVTPQAAASAQDAAQPLRRPGSYLNIVI